MQRVGLAAAAAEALGGADGLAAAGATGLRFEAAWPFDLASFPG